ncbi:methyltetrahydrofolate cobalamin methyltransferase [Halarsenatibacter silvermanii]|uniref:5-methyltetrahydrofolate--homocysteine methyltransferase n=1 Tax=Halarsenatibacter silvermanii TaxID=321763 RepID=A0A1G9P5E0_9FIRM|nr:methyltetrahydrofolate cobalamin methyltransferase [Halarsenatibacter silvermanii]SDL94102.1 5-methyltetrahydrofolate--homocysteine methyltransferase [Halarsenatibacter silvermanii]
MIVIGELINTSREGLEEAVKERDAEFIQDLAKNQEEAGAAYVDVNCGTLIKEEEEAIEWLVETAQEVVDVPLSIDSPNPEAVKRGLEKHENESPPLINSITDEEERYDELLPLIQEYEANVIALCMEDEGMPDDCDDRIRIASNLVDNLKEDGIEEDRIFVDPIIQPIGTDQEMGLHILNAIEAITEKYPEVHITCGLSNISHGMPQRPLLNRAFLVLAMSRGMDSAIIDPLDEHLMSLATASETLLGNDEGCMNYLQESRADNLVV